MEHLPRASPLDTRAERLFYAVTGHPRTIVAIGLLSILLLGSFIPRLTKDTSSDAFTPPELPAAIYRERVKEIFNLEDPMVVAVVNDGPNQIFTPHTLELVRWLTERLAEVPGIDPQGVTSIATEKNVTGTADGMLVELFFEEPPTTQAEADRIRAEVMDLPLLIGKLVAEDGTIALIVAELLDVDDAQEVYEDILELAASAPTDGEEIHVAGEGAEVGYVGAYIDADAQRLNPIAFLVITLVLYATYWTARAVVLPLFVVLGSLAFSVGSMAAAGIPFYMVTNALTVVLIAISVADGVHILGRYYEEIARRPGGSPREVVVRTMVAMWRPVTFTSLTSAAGFLALTSSSAMPPMRWFGVFAAVGVTAAWLYSLFALPAALALLPVRASPAYRPGSGGQPQADAFGRGVGWLGGVVIRRPRRTLLAAGAAIALSLFGASKLVVDDERIAAFRPIEPIYQADHIINRSLDGTSTLEVVIETADPEDLYRPDHLRRIAALQAYLETLPRVGGTISIVDYVMQMNRAMNEDRLEAYVLPEDPDLIAQYFLLYSASGDPSDFEELVDYDFRLANLRVRLNRGRWSDFAGVVEPAQRYIDDHFDAPGIRATLAGGVHVRYFHAVELRRGHPIGVVLAFAAVFAMVAVSFRSVAAGTIALVPVALAVLLVYAVMGGLGIWLGLGSSMATAIAIGLAIDFSVHTLDRLIVLMREERRPIEEAFADLFPTTGRALLFNSIALLLGFGVLMTSYLPSLQEFGLLVGVCVAASFFATLTLLPALLRAVRPAFLSGDALEPVSRIDNVIDG